jgi:hypothetical protein
MGTVEKNNTVYECGRSFYALLPDPRSKFARADDVEDEPSPPNTAFGRDAKKEASGYK